MHTALPADAEEAARTLAEASRVRHHVAIQGGGTKSGQAGRRPADVLLCTQQLDRVLAHRHGDLTATIESGARLDDVNRTLIQHGQWIPLDPPWSDRATIGGVVATNDAGPRRHRFGTPRDLIIGIEIARADGTRAKAGGIVVKNVAGYDLARLMTGSCGSLALILNVTFKLFPASASSRTMIAEVATHAAAGALVNALNASQLTPSALELETAPLRLLVRFESTARSVQHQADAAARQAAGAGARVNIAADQVEARIWQHHAARPWSKAGVIAKVTFLPAQLTMALDAIASAAVDCEWEAIGRAGAGVLLLRLDAEAAHAARIISELRTRCAPAEGSVVVLRGSEDLQTLVDMSGARSDAFGVMQAVKDAFDPLGILPPIG